MEEPVEEGMVRCAYCRGTRAEADCWQSKRTGNWYCRDEYIGECYRTLGERAMLRPLGQLGMKREEVPA